MNITYFYLALVVGLCLSLLCEELFGISAGGMVVPGYLALSFDNVAEVLLIYAASFLIFFIINYILPKFVILFGKRKFVATLIVGVIIKLIIELMFPVVLPFSAIEFRGIGVITPSLLANSYAKQGIRYTLPVSIIVALLTCGIVNLLFVVF